MFKAAFGATEVTLKFVSNEKTPNKSIASMDRMVASMVNHPCIVRYYSCFRTNYANATCMEYICGLDLNRIRETIPQFPEEVSILLTAQLVLAVQHLHLKGFLHRDIKVRFTSKTTANEAISCSREEYLRSNGGLLIAFSRPI